MSTKERDNISFSSLNKSNNWQIPSTLCVSDTSEERNSVALKTIFVPGVLEDLEGTEGEKQTPGARHSKHKQSHVAFS